MASRTPLYEQHEAAGARIVDFAGWEMPVHYGSLTDEHHAVRTSAGMFDVSHMTVVDLHGDRTRDFLRRLLANDVARLEAPGAALYSCMLADDGGVIDDLIAYRGDGPEFRLVVNAATRATDLAWIGRHADRYDVTLRERADLAMIAVQGPDARRLAGSCLGEGDRDRAALAALAPFTAIAIDDIFVARTGYTGEDGFEIILPSASAATLWQSLAAAGVARCGLGARDTLRLEAGLNLYGQDMDTTTTPLESALGWTVAWEPDDRDFIGRAALARQKEAGVPRKLVGLLLEGRGVLRSHQKIVSDAGDGEVTSGTFSPTLGRSIGLARVPAATGERCDVEIRGRRLPVRVVRPPFVRNGKIRIDID